MSRRYPTNCTLETAELSNEYHTPLGEGVLDFGKLSPDILASGLPLVIEGMDIGLKKTVVTKNLTYLKEELLR